MLIVGIIRVMAADPHIQWQHLGSPLWSSQVYIIIALRRVRPLMLNGNIRVLHYGLCRFILLLLYVVLDR